MKHLATTTLAAMIALMLTSCETLKSDLTSVVINSLQSGEPLSMETVVDGLKEALTVGTERTVSQVSAPGGYADSSLQIPLPEQWQGVAKTLRAVGMGSQVDLFQAKMNEAAEQAALQAKPVFSDAIRQMSFQDAKGILQGGDRAATDYFEAKTKDQLAALYQPIVDQKLQEVGAMKVYNDLMTRYNAIPLLPKPSFQPSEYVTTEAMGGLFDVLGQEEKKIRQNPAARTSELLQTVFGSTR